MSREFAFNVEFKSDQLSIVAAGYEKTLSDFVLNIKEANNSMDVLLVKHDIILMAKCVGVTAEDLV